MGGSGFGDAVEILNRAMNLARAWAGWSHGGSAKAQGGDKRARVNTRAGIATRCVSWKKWRLGERGVSLRSTASLQAEMATPSEERLLFRTKNDPVNGFTAYSGLFHMAFSKTDFCIAGCFLLEGLGLRRRLAEDSQPYLRWACVCRARGGAPSPSSTVEYRHAGLSGNSFWKALYREDFQISAGMKIRFGTGPSLCALGRNEKGQVRRPALMGFNDEGCAYFTMPRSSTSKMRGTPGPMPPLGLPLSP